MIKQCMNIWSWVIQVLSSEMGSPLSLVRSSHLDQWSPRPTAKRSIRISKSRYTQTASKLEWNRLNGWPSNSTVELLVWSKRNTIAPYGVNKILRNPPAKICYLTQISRHKTSQSPSVENKTILHPKQTSSKINSSQMDIKCNMWYSNLKKTFISQHILHQHWYTCPITLPVRRNLQHGSLLTVSATFTPGQALSATFDRPWENFSTHLWIALQDKHLRQYTGSISLWISFALSPFAHKKDKTEC
jgi:hypothetical protein